MVDSLFDMAEYAAPADSGKMRESINTTTKLSKAIIESSAAIVWPANYHIIRSPAMLEGLVQSTLSTGQLIFDVETAGLDPWHDKVYCISLGVGGHYYLVPFEHMFMTVASRTDFATIVGPCFNNPNVRLINHNIKFDAHMLEEQLGIPVGPLYADTWLLELILNCTKSQSHGLKEIAVDRYHVEPAGGGNYKQQFGRTAWSHLPEKLAAYYAIKDCDLVDRVFKKQLEALEKKPKLKRLFWEMEMPVLNRSFEVERRGLRVDKDYLDNDLKPWMYEQYGAAVVALKPYIEPYLAEFTVGTGKQKRSATVIDVLESSAKLGKIFFDRLGIPIIKDVTLIKNPKTKLYTKRSLDKNAIAELEDRYPCMKLLGEYRRPATVKKLFIDKLPGFVVKHGENNYRIHMQIRTLGTDTGRMSMAEPNLQQIPSRMGPRVRNAFIADEGCVLISMDFSQQELRIMAHVSRDPKLKQIYFDNKDIYDETAYDLWERSVVGSLETDAQKKASWHRYVTKILILGMNFGMGPPKFSKTAKIPLADGKRLVKRYHSTYPGIGEYQERSIEFGKKHGYIVTMCGRERVLPYINIPDDERVFKDERACFNTPVQGSAADMTKRATNMIYKKIVDEKLPITFWLWVHDEIIYSVDESWALQNRHVINEIQKMQETALPLSVPMSCSAQWERRWASEIDPDDLDDDLLEALEDAA